MPKLLLTSPKGKQRSADEARETFKTKETQTDVFQFGGDASTGLGYCTVSLAGEKTEVVK